MVHGAGGPCGLCSWVSLGVGSKPKPEELYAVYSHVSQGCLGVS